MRARRRMLVVLLLLYCYFTTAALLLLYCSQADAGGALAIGAGGKSGPATRRVSRLKQ